MKYLLITIIALFFFSCGNQKMRYTRVLPSLKAETSTEAKTQTLRIAEDQLSDELSETAVTEVPTEIESNLSLEHSEQLEPVIYALTPKDSVVVIQRTDETTVDAALRAQKHAQISVGFMIGAIVGHLFVFPGIILLIVGIIFYVKASRAKYITEKGTKAQKVARTLMVLNFVIMMLAVILIAGIYFIGGF